MTATSRIRSGFGAGFALLFGVGLAAVLQTVQWEESARAVAHVNHVIERIDELSFESKDANDSARRFVAYQDRIDLARCREALSRARAREQELETLLADIGPARANLLLIRSLIGAQINTLQPALGSPETTTGSPSDVQHALELLNRTGLDSNVRAALLDIASDERLILAARTDWQRRTAVRSRVLFAITSVFSLLLIIVAGRKLSAEQGRREEIDKVLVEREDRSRRLIEMAGDMIYRTDSDGRFVFCNQALLSLLHFSEAEVIGRSYLKLIRQDRRRDAQRFYQRQFLRKQKNSYCELPIIDGHGHERWVGQNVQLVAEADGRFSFQAIARDITERRRTEFELQKSRNFVERIAATMPGILFVYDLVENRRIFSNREVLEVLGYKPEEVPKAEAEGQLAVHPDDESMVNAFRASMRYARDGEVRRLEYRMRHADGHWVWLSGRQTPFERGPDGLVTQIVGISQDVTHTRAAQDKLTWQANYDALTGLSNRHHFQTGLTSILRRASLEQSGVSLCLFDIDFFKEINDRYGHAAGDEVLEAIGMIVRNELRAIDIAGRLGGDEFCFALPRTDANECARVADRVRKRLSTLAFGLSDGSPYSVTATFGIAEMEGDTDMKALMESADRALYRAKSAGRNRVVVDV